MNKGLVAQQMELIPLETPENAINPHHRRVLERFRLAPEKRITFYIYTELLEHGKGNKPVKNVVRIDKVSRKYRTGDNDSHNRVYSGAIEQAAKIACSEVYKLKERKERFSRVFISQFEDALKAKQDKDSFDYFLK